ncbi:MAG: hypothetical protein CL567_01735 [Alphaproteobacteria bacterium]|nr:hypothetical protein [Alphaproteobacteria bacterium]|tara:strand:+ start:1458 stop:2735 length:1278 start_codon:yes stop_codon:yes gene_type:complete
MNRAERRSRHKSERTERRNNVSLAAAVKHLSNGRPNRARQILNGQLNKTPMDASCMHYLGVSYYQLGDFDKANEVLRKTVEIAPEYAEAHNSLGNLLFEIRQIPESVECFRKALSLNSNYANAYTNLGNALRQLGDLSSAEHYLTSAIKIDSLSIRPQYILSSVLIGLGRASEALKVVDQSLKIDPYCQNALAAKVIALQMLEKYSEAEKLQCFDNFIHSLKLKIPSSFNTESEFNSDLCKAILSEPSLTWEPLNRVTRNGAVTQNMLNNPNRAIKQFEKILRQGIDHLKSSLDFDPDHPFLSRIPKKYSLTFVASILREGGWHPSHIHESSWLSGVYYVDVPIMHTTNLVPKNELIDTYKNSGWLEFGIPDYSLPEGFSPITRSFPPEIGVARCFPSYFFHNTVPFTGLGDRIGIAFDVYVEDS